MRALISVFYKTGLVEAVSKLVVRGCEDIVSSGGTAAELQKAGISVAEVSDVTGFPEILDGRVKTLHPRIHGPILAKRTPDHEAQLIVHKMERIDLVCVDLYPFEETIAKPDATHDDIVEKIDIGGVALLRAAAKNYENTLVFASIADLLAWIEKGMPQDVETRRKLAAKAFAVTRQYDSAIACYMSKGQYDRMGGERSLICKYGENPWQEGAAFFRTMGVHDPLGLDKFMLVTGDKPSYNNLLDLNWLLQIMTHAVAGFETNFGPRHGSIALGVKHTNVCGAGESNDPTIAIQKMRDGDRENLFGGLVMFNFPLTAKLVDLFPVHQTPSGEVRMLDGVFAPEVSPEALRMLERKGGKCRVMVNPALAHLGVESLDAAPQFRSVRGGSLQQPNYTFVLNLKDPQLIVHCGALGLRESEDLEFAWAVGSPANSNTIIIMKDRMVIGSGVGQQGRKLAAKLAVMRARDAGHEAMLLGAVAYSDSFFPFPDGPQVLVEAGIRTIFASRGSRNDEAVINFCKEAGITFVTMPDKVCRGFRH